jgi:hypothetical protein
MNRRELLKAVGLGSAGLAALPLTAGAADAADGQPSFHFVSLSMANTVDGVAHRFFMDGHGQISPGNVVANRMSGLLEIWATFTPAMLCLSDLQRLCIRRHSAWNKSRSSLRVLEAFLSADRHRFRWTASRRSVSCSSGVHLSPAVRGTEGCRPYLFAQIERSEVAPTVKVQNALCADLFTHPPAIQVCRQNLW